MPKFEYTAIAADGTLVSGVRKAKVSSKLRAALAASGVQPVSVAKKRSLLQFEITKEKVSRKELMHFSRQLAVFVRAGIPILEAIEVISSEMTDKLFNEALLDMADLLRTGHTLAAAVTAHPEAFPPFYVGVLKSAEVTGNVDTVLDQLADYIERDLEVRREITSALVYPAVVMMVAIATVLVLTIFVLPRFADFFESLDAKLPLATRILISFSSFLTNWWFVFAGLGLVSAIAIGASVRTEKGRELRDRLLLKIPVAQELVRTAVLERFCRILSSMVRAGVPLSDAMSITSDATNNIVYRRGIDSVRDAMTRGEGFAAPLAATGLFPATARQMFRVGEDTGSLDQQLETAATYFDRELGYKLKRFTSLFEPAVIIFMGFVVGFVAIALVSAMYGIYGQVKT